MSAPALSKVIAEIKKRGVAKSSHFICEFTPPTFLIPGAGVLEVIPLYCEQANFPDMMLATQQVKDFGLTREVVVDKSYGSFSLTFACDSKMIIKQFFDQWVQGPVYRTGGLMMYPDAYTSSTMRIHQVNEEMDLTYSVVMSNVYPKMVSDVILARSSRDINRFTATFAFEKWESFMYEKGSLASDATTAREYGGKMRQVTGPSASVYASTSPATVKTNSTQNAPSYTLSSQSVILGKQDIVFSDRDSVTTSTANTLAEKVVVGYGANSRSPYASNQENLQIGFGDNRTIG